MQEGWERSQALVILQKHEIEKLIEPFFGSLRLREFGLLSGGLANTNYRLLLSDQKSYVLRIYTRDESACLREKALSDLLLDHSDIPMPTILYINTAPEGLDFPISIQPFVDGILMEEVLKSASPKELHSIAEACGSSLAKLSRFKFPACAGFDSNLNLVEPHYGEAVDFVPEAVLSALDDKAAERLGPALSKELAGAITKLAPRLKVLASDNRLLHADFKPSNILLMKSAESESYELSALLDWEFCCAGPPMMDFGIMLRGRSTLPIDFERSFAMAFHSSGGELPEEWEIIHRTLDFISLCTFLNKDANLPILFQSVKKQVKENLQFVLS